MKPKSEILGKMVPSSNHKFKLRNRDFRHSAAPREVLVCNFNLCINSCLQSHALFEVEKSCSNEKYQNGSGQHIPTREMLEIAGSMYRLLTHQRHTKRDKLNLRTYRLRITIHGSCSIELETQVSWRVFTTRPQIPHLGTAAAAAAAAG